MEKINKRIKEVDLHFDGHVVGWYETDDFLDHITGYSKDKKEIIAIVNKQNGPNDRDKLEKEINEYYSREDRPKYKTVKFELYEYYNIDD